MRVEVVQVHPARTWMPRPLAARQSAKVWYENQLDTAAKMRAGRAARTFSRRWCAPARVGSVGEIAGAEPLRENLFAARSQTGRKWDFYPDELNHNAEYRLHLSPCSDFANRSQLFPVPLDGLPKTRANAGPGAAISGRVFCTPVPRSPGRPRRRLRRAPPRPARPASHRRWDHHRPGA